MNFLPFAILGYALNGVSTLVDKILLNKSLPSPFIYAFYINILGLLALFAIPFGVNLSTLSILFGTMAGVTFVFALLSYFESLRMGEASVVSPIVGALNPLFALLIGVLFLNQGLSRDQLIAFSILILGATILTSNIWLKKLHFNKQLLFMILAGGFFGLSAVFLKITFDYSDFISGLVISRVGGALMVLLFLVSSNIRSQVFSSQVSNNGFKNKTAGLMIFGQSMGAISGLLIAFAISLTFPALVNALFGIQYLVILGAALILAKNHPTLLDERLTRSALFQKIIGAGVLSWGVYLLSK